MKVKVLLVAGARPNFMKIAPLYFQLKKHPDKFEPILLHTGQHYDEKMSEVFFKELGLPVPDIYLGVGSGSHAKQTAEIMQRFEHEFLQRQPDLVLVVGDVNSTIACALVAVKSRIPTESLKLCRQRFDRFLQSRKAEYPITSLHKKRDQADQVPLIVHVESGERSFDFSMPEEINRVLTDVLADILFTASEDSTNNLLWEGTDPRKIFFVGNIMIDSLQRYLAEAEKSQVLKKLNLEMGNYALATLHRPGNVDEPESLKKLLSALSRISEKIPVIFPMHPRTRKLTDKLRETEALKLDNGRFILTEPLGYIDFLSLQKSARVVLTDSGGVQVETSYLGVPCLTLRQNTEWEITIREGTNQLVPPEEEAIIKAATTAIDRVKRQPAKIKYWDGETAERIVKHLMMLFQ